MELIPASDFIWALAQLTDPLVLLVLVIGVMAGMVFGAAPGITATAGIAIITPITFTMGFEQAMALLLGAYCGGYFAGSIPAILINVPGTPGNAATALDGYPMARDGFADRAISLAVVCSAIGGLVSATFLLTIAPTLARFALEFTAPEYFWLAMLGLVCVAGVAGDSLLKGFAAAAFGVVLSTVGQDPVGGTMRLTFDEPVLVGGIPIIPALIGLFGVTEMFTKATESSHLNAVLPPQKNFRLAQTMKDILDSKWVTLKSALIGTFIGLLPGTGSAIASWVSYGETSRSADADSRFGQGDPRGVIASETANNAVTGGAMIPLLTFGIPGDPVTAVLIGALLVHGIDPGPFFISENGGKFAHIILMLVAANIVMVIVGLGSRRFLHAIVKVPGYVLVPAIGVLSAAGAFSINSSFFEVNLVIILGIVGYFLLCFGFPMAPIVLGIVLGPIVEDNLRSGLAGSDMDPTPFFMRPISAGLIVLILVLIGYWIYSGRKQKP
jgi:putative tricarboxylic transport membrane protein